MEDQNNEIVDGSQLDCSSTKAEFEAPKLTYVKPELAKHSLAEVTAGFFGSFYT
jgi:hypothetical protein